MIAVIGGTGHLGLGLAMRWAAARVPVVIGSRSPERAREAAEKVRTATGGGPVEGKENAEAAHGAEGAQRFLGDRSRVVATFHTVPASLLVDLSRPVDCDVLVCGDDADAKVRVIALAGTFGARGVDVGALRRAHTLERLTASLVSAGRRVRRHERGVRITGLR